MERTLATRVKSVNHESGMAMRPLIARASTFALTAALLAGASAPARAQRYGDGFLFHEPDVRLSVRAGYAHANAASDVFDDAVTNLTLNRKDFSGVTLGAEIGFPITSHLEGSLDVGYSHSRTGSEFRHFVDNNNLPIEQTTTFERVPITLNLRANLLSPGRSIGRLAWIPSKVVPWVGAGVGGMWSQFVQDGDFVNFANNNVFNSRLESSDWTFMSQAMGGVDISLTPILALTADARYLWAKARLDQEFFTGYKPIDLSGAQATLGLTFRL